MRTFRRLAATGILVAIVWSFSSCGDSGTGPPPGPSVCLDSVTVTVTPADTQPIFSWTPDCTVGRLIVEQGFDEYWGTETCGENSYRSPIRYSSNPPNTCPEEPAIPLAPGLTYKVSLWRFVTVNPESLQLLGWREFSMPVPECAGPVTVSVSSDSLPVFSWTPDCTIGRLVVEKGLDPFWRTSTCGENAYRSPIQYSMDPGNACPGDPALVLASDSTYTVSVWRFVTVNPESLQLLGSRQFVY